VAQWSGAHHLTHNDDQHDDAVARPTSVNVGRDRRAEQRPFRPSVLRRKSMRRLLSSSNSSGSVRVAAGGTRRRTPPVAAAGHCCLIYHPSRCPSVRPRSPNVIVMSSFIGPQDGRSVVAICCAAAAADDRQYALDAHEPSMTDTSLPANIHLLSTL